jgi:hypothetical protein
MEAAPRVAVSRDEPSSLLLGDKKGWIVPSKEEREKGKKMVE